MNDLFKILAIMVAVELAIFIGPLMLTVWLLS